MGIRWGGGKGLGARGEHVGVWWGGMGWDGVGWGGVRWGGGCKGGGGEYNVRAEGKNKPRATPVQKGGPTSTTLPSLRHLLRAATFVGSQGFVRSMCCVPAGLHARSATWHKAASLMILVGQQSTDTNSWATCVVREGAQLARALDGLRYDHIRFHPTVNCRGTVVEAFLITH